MFSYTKVKSLTTLGCHIWENQHRKKITICLKLSLQPIARDGDNPNKGHYQEMKLMQNEAEW
jgi:hypothetical protein